MKFILHKLGYSEQDLREISIREVNQIIDFWRYEKISEEIFLAKLHGIDVNKIPYYKRFLDKIKWQQTMSKSMSQRKSAKPSPGLNKLTRPKTS